MLLRQQDILIGPCLPVSWVPPAGSFLSRQEAPQECGLREALTAACSRRRADVLVVRLPPAIDSLDSLRDAPPSLKNPFRRAFTSEQQCFGGFLLKCSISENLTIRHVLLLFSHGENSLQKLKFQSIPCPVLAGRRCRGYVGSEAGKDS